MADRAISTRPRYTFGPYLLDPANRRLTRDGKVVPVTARVFDILVALVQQPGQPLDKDTLIACVWGDTAVEEGNLARSVSTLRKLLGDSPEDHRYIVTLPGRGYQFVAAVRIVDGGLTDTESSSVVETVDRGEPATRRSVAPRPVTVAVATAALTAVAIAIAFIPTRPMGPSSSTPPRIVALPFKNMGPDPDEYVAAGITEEITSRLTAVQALRVVSRTTASRYGRSGKTAREIGAELGADYLLEGSVLWNRPATPAERVRIAAQLIRAADDTHVWAETFDRDVENFFAV